MKSTLIMALISMRLYPSLLLLIAISVLAHLAACTEIAYIIGPFGENPVGYANITEYEASDKVSFTVSARGLESTTYTASRDVDSIKDEINRKINRGNDLVRDKGLDLVGSKSGAQRIDQICSIYDYMVGNWTFVSDWKGLDEFQYSNYTLKKGTEVRSSGKGDCDDFSILLSALIESIGGTPRIVFAYSPDGGHAYTEVYLGKKGDQDLDMMLRWLRTAYMTNAIYIHENPENGDVWLNMDWWKDPVGAYHPGGPFYRAATQIPMYIKENEGKTPLTPVENLLPRPLFIYIPLQPEVDEMVRFDASESIDPDGKIEDYEWNFGDGETAHGITKSVCMHSFSSSGKFLVNLNITDNEGDHSTKTVEINVKEPLYKNYDETPQPYDKPLDNPQDAETWNNKGVALAGQNQYDEAIQAFDHAIQLDPQYAKAWNNKGVALAGQNQYDEAIKAYDEAIRLDPQYAKAWQGRGLALKALGRNAEADTAFAKAKELGYAG
jgi:tetratricopeptide (TPR) repeat protein